MPRTVGQPERRREARPRRVVIAAFPGVNLLDVSGPAEVFTALAEIDGRREYAVELASTTRDRKVVTSSGVALAAEATLARVSAPVDTLVVPGGSGTWDALEDASALRHLKRIAASSRRVASVCTGAFLLAAAGLLDGRRATTHWRWCERLGRDHPSVDVEPDAIFVREGAVATSAGVTTGMDLALSLVEEDLGRAAASSIARHLVLFVRRPGGQSQFSPLLEMQAAERRPLRDLQEWVAANLAEDLSVASLAGRVHMSERNFARAFVKEIGGTPARFVERLRVDAARRRLEDSDAGLDQVARDCGFHDADAMRRSFVRVLRVSPSDYRKRFRVHPA